MTNAENVIIPEAFAQRIDAAKIEELKAAGAISSNPLPFDKLELPEIGYGDHVLGTLTDAECELYSAYYETAQRLDDMGRGASADFFENAAQAIRDKKENDFAPDNLVSEEFKIEFFRVQRQAEYLKALFYFTLCEKYNCHDYTVGVRTGRRFVKNKRKF